MKITINLENEGLDCIFKPYQKRIMEFLWSQSTPKRSFDIWHGVGAGAISRASIINSLHWLRDLGFLSETTKTGKGGHRGLYTAAKTKEEIIDIVRHSVYEQLDHDFDVQVEPN